MGNHPDKFAALTHPKPGAKMTTRCPRKAAKVFEKLIAETKKAH